ncbi:MAG: hypothetical protein O3A49_05915 [Candidatus Marinimicrobia bacterium]|nr:hypothetical protein [Candidatus Neomarinimicrobiota bacterium]
MKTLLIIKRSDGIGDWIMTMSVIKMINYQYPDIDIFVKLNFENSKYKNFIIDIIKNSNVNVNFFQSKEQNYNYTCDGLRYPSFADLRKRNEQYHVIKYMIDDLNTKTKLNVEYHEHLLSKIVNIQEVDLKKPYVVMPSVGRYDKGNFGKPGYTQGKHFGYENYNKLSYYFWEKGINVVQIGAKNDPALEYATDIFLNIYSRPTLGILKNCLFYVGEENGLLHLAGHNDIKSYGLYLGLSHPFFTSYKDQIPIFCNDKSVEQIFKEIKCEKIF